MSSGLASISARPRLLNIFRPPLCHGDESSPFRFVRSQCNVEHRERDGARVGGGCGWVWEGERESSIDFFCWLLIVAIYCAASGTFHPSPFSLARSLRVSFWHMFYFCKHFRFLFMSHRLYIFLFCGLSLCVRPRALVRMSGA